MTIILVILNQDQQTQTLPISNFSDNFDKKPDDNTGKPHIKQGYDLGKYLLFNS